MGPFDYRFLAKAIRLDPERAVSELREALGRGRRGEAQGLRPQEFSLRRLAETTMLVGGEPLGTYGVDRLLHESTSAVDSTVFANITGQIVYTELMQAFENEEFVLSRLIRTVPTQLSGEKVPGFKKIDDEEDDFIVKEQQPYPRVGYSEDYIETPETVKRGFIVGVTREAIYFDRTGAVLEQARTTGQILGLGKEKRIIDVVIGATNNYKWRGTTYDTYQTSTPWINQKSGVDLVDWTDVEEAELLFAEITDPNTGEPVLVGGPMTLLVTPHKLHTARSIINATEIRRGDITTGTGTQTISGNVLDNYAIVSSRLYYRRLQDALGLAAANAQDYWHLGNFAEAFSYMENWPITVTQAPANAHEDFTQDIVTQFKASERGVCAVREPRKIVQLYNS